MSRTPARRAVAPPPAAGCPRNDDCQMRSTEALESIAASLISLTPAANTVHDLADRLERLCVFLRKKGPWLLASAPLVASIVGAVIPELGPWVKAIAAAFAAQAGAGGAG